ncbi:unnamed protein product [Orchesella dallaii]|uniref:Aldehyde dehydrogenase domain-containing protein n=1 Tax=Orchesella dallaii TaxID=48710 RepID=A0ABP1PXB9_9HEXA
MSNAQLLSKNKGSTDIKDLFASMSYSERRNLEDTSSIVSWLKHFKRSVLGSVINGYPLESEALAVSTKIENIPVKVKLLNSELDVVEGIRKALKISTRQSITPVGKSYTDPAKVIQQLLKKISKDLILLEAFAGQIPTWVVKQQDEPSWLYNPEDLWISSCTTQFGSNPLAVFLHPVRENYSIKDILPVLHASVVMDCPLIIILALNTDTSDINLTFPIVYLLDKFNDERIRVHTIDLLVVNRKVLLPSLFTKLNEVGIKNKILLGSLALQAGKELPQEEANLIMEFPSAAVVNLTNDNGKGLHHIIDSSADLFSATNSVVRNTWLSGININHRSRSLLFVHQPVYSQVLEKLKQCLDQMNVIDLQSEIPTGCDFVKRTVNELSPLLACIDELGATKYPPNSKFDVPTVIYDIGTSSDIVANKGIGLGCLLILVPYRSVAELVSLFNNQKEADNVFIYANEINTTMDIIRSIKGREITVNGAPSVVPNRIAVSWASFLSESTPLNVQGGECRGSNLNLTLSAAGCKEWQKLSNERKVGELVILAQSSKETPRHIPLLLSYYMDLTSQNIIRAKSEGLFSLVLINPIEISDLDIIVALTGAILSERPVVIVLVNGKLSQVLEDTVKYNLPEGLVTIVNVETYGDAISTVRNGDMLWVMKGSEVHNTPLLRLPKGVSIKTLFVNGPGFIHVMDNAKMIISSSHRKYYM